MGAFVRLRHTNVNDDCEAYIKSDLTFDLRPLTQQFQYSNRYLDCMQVRVTDELTGRRGIKDVSTKYIPTNLPNGECRQIY